MPPIQAIQASSRYPFNIPALEASAPVKIGKVVMPNAYTAWYSPIAVDLLPAGISCIASEVAKENKIPVDIPGNICSSKITGTLPAAGTRIQYKATTANTSGIQNLGPLRLQVPEAAKAANPTDDII